MGYPLTITGPAMREINRSAVLEIIRRDSPTSRTAIADRLEISLATVMRIVDELIDQGFVRSQGSTEWSGGRRRSLLEFNADGYVVIGIDMGGPKIYGAISNLGGEVLEEIFLDQHASPENDGYERLTGLIDKLLSSPNLEGRRVRGIGVGVPGVTLHNEGIVKWAYAYQWKEFPLKSKLSERYNLPIIVDNDMNLAALGELWFGAGQNTQNMICMTIDIGIGAGIIIDGALYRGSHEASGEIGNMIPNREFLRKNYQEFGALESIASGTGVVERAKQVLQTRRNPIDINTLTIEKIFDSARQGQKWAQDIVDDTLDNLAIVITNLTVSFDPDLIVLSGATTDFTDLIIEPILERINGAIPIAPKLAVSKLGRRAIVMGAITNILHNTSNFYVVHKLS
jgi:glucokinase